MGGSTKTAYEHARTCLHIIPSVEGCPNTRNNIAGQVPPAGSAPELVLRRRQVRLRGTHTKPAPQRKRPATLPESMLKLKGNIVGIHK